MAKDKVNELNNGIDDINGANTEQPWVEDSKNQNEGYPILKWQLNV